MMFRTHLAFGILVSLIVMPFLRLGNKYLFFGLVIFGSLLPDVDTPHSKLGHKLGPLSHIFKFIAGHRGIFHSLFFALLLPGLVFYFVSRIYGTAIFIGYMSHLIIDGFTESGINFLNPISTLRLSGFVKTGSFTEKIILGLIIVGIIILVI